VGYAQLDLADGDPDPFPAEIEGEHRAACRPRIHACPATSERLA